MQKPDKNRKAPATAAFADRHLSLRAKGIAAILTALPKDCPQTIDSLAGQTSDGRTAVGSALRELEEKGYINRSREARARDGRLRQTVITLKNQEDD